VKKAKRKPLGIVLVGIVTIGGISLLSCLYGILLRNTFFSTLAGVLTYMTVLWLLSRFQTHWFDHEHINDPHRQILDAIAEVARGNFNVIISSNERDPHGEMAEAFNKMARDLGDLETMRQDFISNVSHEIQSPLTSIGGFAALLKNDAIPVGERLHYAEIIEAETKRLSSLSDNLLKLSALGSEKKPLNPTEYRLDKQLQEIALMLEPQWAAKNINLELDAERSVITADKDLMSQVWVNLLGNAIKFTKDAIKITLRDNAVTIEDNGAGIAENDLAHIFERFYKADKARERSLGGSGLGLSIVKKIVDMHGGSVTAAGEAGRGTVFTLTLPRDLSRPV
jgi:signal transduction histidine kinase